MRASYKPKNIIITVGSLGGTIINLKKITHIMSHLIYKEKWLGSYIIYYSQDITFQCIESIIHKITYTTWRILFILQSGWKKVSV